MVSEVGTLKHAVETGDYIACMNILTTRGIREDDHAYDLLCDSLNGEDVDIARSLIMYGAPLNERKMFPRTDTPPLHIAAMDGVGDIVELLLNKGSKVNARDENFDTALHLACRDGRIEAAQILLEHGADANADGFYLATPLHKAVVRGCLKTIALLMEHGATAVKRDAYSKSALHVAVAARNTKATELILSKYMVGSVRHTDKVDLESRSRGGMTPLHLASSKGALTCVKQLINVGANIHSRDNKGKTPLHHAATSGRVDLVERLIRAGSDPNALDDQNKTPAFYAEDSNAPLSIVLLLQIYSRETDEYIVEK